MQFEIYKHGNNYDDNDDNDDDKEDLCMYHMHGCTVDCEAREDRGLGLNFSPSRKRLRILPCIFVLILGLLFLFVTQLASGLGAFSVTAIFVTSCLWQLFVINFILY